MSDPRKRVLFMDDQTTTEYVVKEAIRALEEAGFEVEAIPLMAWTRDAFYQRYFHVFVLDIDMSLAVDDEEGDGTDVGRFFKTLDADARVIYFSARGGLSAWFAAANHHVYGYLDKRDEGVIQALVELVRRAAAEPPLSIAPAPGLPRPPRRALLAMAGPCTKPAELLAAELARGLGEGGEVVTVAGLAAAAERLEQEPDGFVAALVACDRFSTRPSAAEQVRRIAGHGGRPHALFACQGDHSYGPAPFLVIVNAHPFRLLDLLDRQLGERIAEGVQRAVACYGRPEVLPADPAGQARLQLGFSAETARELGGEPWPEDEAESWAAGESWLATEAGAGAAPVGSVPGRGEESAEEQETAESGGTCGAGGEGKTR
ncbi:MAG: response regulator [Deltaproteobacteria bacterium]|nr:response regulator [Deltaproteobacteria bacterium]